MTYFVRVEWRDGLLGGQLAQLNELTPARAGRAPNQVGLRPDRPHLPAAAD
jgi:hypothetical protein